MKSGGGLEVNLHPHFLLLRTTDVRNIAFLITPEGDGDHFTAFTLPRTNFYCGGGVGRLKIPCFSTIAYVGRIYRPFVFGVLKQQTGGTRPEWRRGRWLLPLGSSLRWAAAWRRADMSYPHRRGRFLVGATDMHVDDIPSLYEPINTYKPFAAHIGIVDGPFEYLSVFGARIRSWPFTTRMTVVQLAKRDLFLHPPVRYDAALAQLLQGMGIVRHLVSPNRGHYAHIGEWARAFPDALTWASPRVRERARSQRNEVSFARDLAGYAPPEWSDEFDQTIIPGAFLDEVVFFHRESKTLILADTIVNVEPDKIGRLHRFIASLAGICAPSGGMSPDIRLAFWPSRRKLRPALERVLSWQPERIILSHGRCFEINGCAVLERAFNSVV